MIQKELICIIGPTGVGKTDLAIEVAKELQSEIISCDSRQVYHEMKIGTAVPSVDQLATVPHHFIGTKSIHDYYSVFEYEKEALNRLAKLFTSHDKIVLTGGSGLYLNALLWGMDNIPDPDPEIRETLIQRLESDGLDPLRFELKALDPIYYNQVDIRNPKRVLRGLEVCLTTGKPFSAFRIKDLEPRPFTHRIICLDRDRAELHGRINQRVDQMVTSGLIDEVQTLHPLKHLNALKTVGYRELFDAFEGKHTIAVGLELIKRNSRRYARKQITWNRQYDEAQWILLGEDLANAKNLILS